jgi:hypothetical protein
MGTGGGPRHRKPSPLMHEVGEWLSSGSLRLELQRRSRGDGYVVLQRPRRVTYVRKIVSLSSVGSGMAKDSGGVWLSLS